MNIEEQLIFITVFQISFKFEFNKQTENMKSSSRLASHALPINHPHQSLLDYSQK